MVVSNALFDGILFGALLLAALLDSFVPALHGAASLLAVGAATYVAAQELSDALQRRHIWTQESLATAIAPAVAGFIYFWWRNQSDFALLVLSIGLMMASLMVTIAVIGALGTAWKERTPAPLIGWLVTAGGAIALGGLAGVLILALGKNAGSVPLVTKIVIVALALAFWKWRERARPPQPSPSESPAATPSALPESTLSATLERMTGAPAPKLAPAATLAPATPAARWALVPQRGTLLDRFLPALVIGALLFLGSRELKHIMAPLSPSASASSNVTTPANP